MAPPFLTAAQIDAHLAWPDVVAALDAGHGRDRAHLDDLLLQPTRNGLLNRAAWIPGLGFGMKSASIFPDNPSHTPPLPTVQGVFVLFDGETGEVRALIDGGAITGWKTAADSALGARYLARPDSRELLVVGAGTVARNLIPAYAALFPDLARIRVVSRTRASAQRLADDMARAGHPAATAADLESALATADIVATATVARTPILPGRALRPGTHVDLVGAFAADMREADDAVLQRGEVFVDSRDSTRHHIGEIKIPVDAGAIAESAIRGDLYDLHAGRAGRSGPDAITVYKNGGGAHLDLMVADLMVRRCLGVAAEAGASAE